MTQPTSQWAFLKSTRFWALVIGGLAVVAEGGFTLDAWMKGIMGVVLGFTAVRTVDRNADKKVEAAEIQADAVATTLDEK